MFRILFEKRIFSLKFAEKPLFWSDLKSRRILVEKYRLIREAIWIQFEKRIFESKIFQNFCRKIPNFDQISHLVMVVLLEDSNNLIKRFQNVAWNVIREPSGNWIIFQKMHLFSVSASLSQFSKSNVSF